MEVAEVKRQCEHGTFFDDVMINCAQVMIKQQCDVDGLQDTLVGQRNLFDVKREALQILHTGREHWVTVRTTGCDSALIYDSQGSALTNALMTQIANLLICFDNKITVHRRSVQLQGVNDCGPMAIAFAWSLARGMDPEKLTYQNPRGHVRNCILKGQFTNFPLQRLGLFQVPAATFHFKVIPQGKNGFRCETL